MDVHETEKILKDAVLVFPVEADYVLLGRKLQKIGKGKYNGWGGGIEPGEMPIDAAIREPKEETETPTNPGVRIHRAHLEKVAEMSFYNTTEEGITFVCKVHVYLAHKYDGHFAATKEMGEGERFVKGNLPLDELMPADRYWLPRVLAGEKIIGRAWYTPHQAALIGEVEIEKASF